MKTLIQESTSVLRESSEADTYKILNDNNQGREGKPVISVANKEISGSIWLGDYKYAVKVNGRIKLVIFDFLDNKKHEVMLTNNEIKLLSRI